MILNIIAANRTITELTADRDGLVAKCQGLETEIENLKKMSKEMTETQAQHNEVIAKLKEEYEKKISDLVNANTVTLDNVANKAADIVASLGVEPEEIKVVPEELNLTKNDVLKKLQTLDGKDAQEYYQKHKDVIWK